MAVVPLMTTILLAKTWFKSNGSAYPTIRERLILEPAQLRSQNREEEAVLLCAGEGNLRRKQFVRHFAGDRAG